MTYVCLQRTFQALAEDASVADIPSRNRFFAHIIEWTELLRAKRTIISGAAGAGKTEEMKARTRELIEQGVSAFFLPMRTVAKSGFAPSLTPTDAERFKSWAESSDDGYFFIDSKDEAVQAGEHIDDALRKLGQELGPKLDRAHIYVSTRPSDLTVKQDVETFRQFCPLVSAYSSSETPEQVLLSVFDSEENSHAARLEKLAAQRDFLVVRLAPLGDIDARTYVSQKADLLITNAEDFFAALRSSGLRSLAAYPRDLSIFAKYWLRHNSIAAYRVMLNEFCEESLKEVRPHCVVAHVTPINTARQMVERFAAYCAIGGVGGILTIGEPDVPNTGVKADSCQAKDIWPEHTPNDHLSVQSRAIFDSVVVGQLRLRRDLVEHLAATWMRRVYASSEQRWRVHREVLVSSANQIVVLNSRASMAILLSLDDNVLFDQMLTHAPLRFMVDTVVHAFPEQQRIRILMACSKVLAAGADLRRFGWGADSDILRAFTFPGAIAAVRSLWLQHADASVNLRVFLLWILGEARGHDCADIALDAATRVEWEERTNLLAIQALAASSDVTAKAALIKQLLADEKRDHFTLKATHRAIDYLFPDFISNRDFVKLAVRWGDDSGEGPYALHSYARDWADRVKDDSDQATLLKACVNRIAENTKCDHPEYELPVPNNKLLFAFASRLAERWLLASEGANNDDILIESCVQLLSLDASHSSASDSQREIVRHLNTRLRDKHQIYWAQIALARVRRDVVGKGTTSRHDVWNLARFSWSREDIESFYDIGLAARNADDRKIALDFLFDLDAEHGKNAAGLTRLQSAVHEDKELSATLEKLLEPRIVDPTISAHQKQFAEYNAKEKAKVDRQKEHLIQLQRRLQTHADPLDESDLVLLWKWLSSRSQKKTHSADAHQLAGQLPALGYAFGQHIAKTFDSGLRAYWRKHLVVPARIEGSSMSSSVRARMALLGLELEFGGDRTSIASGLSQQEIERGLGWAMAEGSLPNWIDNLAPSFGAVVRAQLTEPLLDRLADENEHYQPIRDLQYRLPRTRELLAPDLLQWLRDNRRKPDNVLDALLQVLGSASCVDRNELARLLDDRVREGTAAQLMYLRHLMQIDAARAATHLSDVACPSIDRAAFFAETFGDHGRRHELGFLPETSVNDKRNISFHLVQLAIAAVDPRSDEDRSGEGPHTPSPRDNAQEGRNYLLATLGKLPGGLTIAALRTIQVQPEAKSLHDWIARMIELRIAEDAEPTPWTATQLIEIETYSEATPTTGKQLLQLVMDRLADIQHELRDGPHSNIGLLQRAQSEEEFQIWLTSELNKSSSGRFSAVREPEVASKKKPDILVTSSHASAAQVAIEMKLVDKKWTVKQLEDGLASQLVGQYLQHESCCHGIYVLVRQRKTQWPVDGRRVTFDSLLKRLASQAARLNECMSNGGEVVVLQKHNPERERNR